MLRGEDVDAGLVQVQALKQERTLEHLRYHRLILFYIVILIANPAEFDEALRPDVECKGETGAPSNMSVVVLVYPLAILQTGRLQPDQEDADGQHHDEGDPAVH